MFVSLSLTIFISEVLFRDLHLWFTLVSVWRLHDVFCMETETAPLQDPSGHSFYLYKIRSRV